MVRVGVGVDAEIGASLHAVQLATAAIDRADVQSWSMAAPLRVLGAGRVARAAAVGTDATVAAFPQALWARATARLGVELLAAGALQARAFALAAALVALVALRTLLFRTARLLLFLRLG